ncbi:MMPL family transporter [Maridesulfovibrio sp.]|uniref:MMPL family transporter n=1 Tax=Maridesulfovibrio sp. TaxID=2795000 RepID=UPI0029CA0364|nr:MMPL family transporter [Maridesulfovibrio sp.]
MFSRKTHNHAAADRKTQRKGALFLLLFTFVCAIPLLSVSFSEDISGMLPTGEKNEISRDFKLLQKSPLAGKVLISISSESLGELKLVDVAESIAGRMNSPLLSVEDNSTIQPQAVINFLLRQAPNLTTGKDLEKLQGLTSTESINKNLINAKKLLISPAGMGMRTIIAADPLNLRSVYLHKISSLQNLPRLKISSGQYFIAGKNALLIVGESNIPMTDSKNGYKLLDRFQEIKQEALAENNLTGADLNIEIMSGHCYSVANSSVIKRDILTVSIISICALGLLFFMAFRNRGALSIFLAPGVAIMTGLGVCAFIYKDMSAIVIGFGAVLMGISIDFAVHTYFALAENPNDEQRALRDVSRPVLYGAATSCASFTALYISGIPGIRQLSVFSVSGIIAACFYALLFVPRFCNSFPAGEKRQPVFQAKGNPKIILGAAFILLAGSSVATLTNNFDTELKNLGYISKEISKTERIFQEKWNQMRSRSMLFAYGKTMDEALNNNEKAWADINKNLGDVKAVSIAPVLPSAITAQKNITNWSRFWQKRKAKTEEQISKEAKSLGFATHAFSPAMNRISELPPALSVKSFRASPLAPLAKMFIPAAGSNGEKQIITLLPDNKRIMNYYTPRKEKELGVRLVSQSRFKATLEKEMERDILRFITCSGLLVAALIFILFRNLRRALLAVFPAVFGVAVTFGLLGIMQIPLNIFHIVALPLVIGLGADYGIFMVFQEIRMPSLWTVKAVKISGLTTLAGFGVLVFARHPSLHSLGTTVCIGITAALCCAVIVLPHLLRLEGDGHA